MRRGLVVAAVAVTLVVSPGRAVASGVLSDTVTSTTAAAPRLKLTQRGVALIEYTTDAGVRRHVLAWGAINANLPSQSVPQVRFRFDYSGGWRTYHKLRYWKTVKSTCKPYTGPPLVYLVAACTAPDGSFWALQAWQRLLPLLGFDAWLPSQSKWELHLSHWSGPLADLEVYAHWTYGGSQVGVFGRLLYRGVPVHGFRSTQSGNPNDYYGRNVYIDTLDSAYGPGWKRESGILLHNPGGTFCHSFVPGQKPFAGYPSQAPRPLSRGSRYRVTVIGPGVTPDLQWEGADPGPFDAAQDQKLKGVFDQVMAGDGRCAPER